MNSVVAMNINKMIKYGTCKYYLIYNEEVSLCLEHITFIFWTYLHSPCSVRSRRHVCYEKWETDIYVPQILARLIDRQTAEQSLKQNIIIWHPAFKLI